MPRSEHSTFTTTLDASKLKGILSSVLAGALVEPLDQGPLDDDSAVAIVASQRGGLIKKSPFGPGMAAAQVIVEDHGSTRSVEIVACGTSLTEGLNAQRGAGNAAAGMVVARQQPNLKFSRKMVAAIVAALEAADPGMRKTS